jgi:hypothetical protein
MHKDGLNRLAGFRTAEKKLRLSAGLARWGTHLSAGLLLLIALQSLISLNPPCRILLLIIAGIGLAFSFWQNVRLPLASCLFHHEEPSLNSIALRIGRHYPQLQDRLANALQIAALPENETNSLSPGLISAVRESIADLFAGIELSRHLERTPARAGWQRFAAVVAVNILAWLFFVNTLSVGLERTLYPNRELSRQLAMEFLVSPGEVTLLRGEPVTIRAWTKTLTMGDLQIELDRFGRQELLSMTRGVKDTFFYSIPSLRDSLRYRIRYQKAASRSYALRITDLPMIRTLQLRVQPPSYSGAESFLLEENIGDVTALKGSRIDWQAETNKPAAEARLLFASGRTQPLNIAARRLFTSFSLLTDDSYYAELVDDQGRHSENPIVYRLRPLTDQYPFIRIVSPSGDIDLHEDMLLPLLLQAQDDYGISAMTLRYQVTREDATEIDSTRFHKIDLPLSRPPRVSYVMPYTWDLSASPLLPSEVLLYYVTVFDNDSVSGPKSASTAIYRARFPSIYELYEEVNKTQDEAIAEMEESYEKSLELKSRLDDLALQLQRADELSWQKKQEVNDALQQKEALQQNLQKISDRLDEMIQNMAANQLISPETMQKYQELQELYREIMTPELQKSMNKVAEAMQNIDPAQLQKALEEYKLSEEALNKNLDRTLSLLKRLKIEQQLDQTMRMAEDLQKRQEELAEQAMQEATPPEKLAESQDALQQDLEKLQESLSSLEQEMADQPAMPQEQVAAANQELEKAGLNDQMQGMQQAIQQGNRSRMKQHSDQITGGLQKARDRLQQAKDEMTGAMAQRAMQAMQRGIHNLLTLSRMQEGLMRETEAMPQTSARIPETAERQQQLASGLDRIINDLYSASKESFGITPQIGKTLGQTRQAMQQALQGLENRELAQAADKQGQAMNGLNGAVLQMDAALQSMAQGGGSGMSMADFLHQMQKLAEGQQGINGQTLGLDNLGQALSLAQQAAMARLARQQGSLRKSLDELAAEAAGLSELLGDLGHVSEEMEQVEKDFAARRVDRQTIERQNRILSRMLDYQRSMREHEPGRERRAETGKIYNSASPAELPADLGQRREQLQQDLLRAKQEGYSRDYLELIRKYFESLREHDEQN